MSLALQTSYAQEQEEKPRKNLFGVGTSIGGPAQNLGAYMSVKLGSQDFELKASPMINFFYEHNIATISDNVYMAIGGNLMMKRYTLKASDEYHSGDINWSYDYKYEGTCTINLTSYAARFSFNYVHPDNAKFRVYAALLIGSTSFDAKSEDKVTITHSYNGKSETETDKTPSVAKVSVTHVQAYAGIRYFFSKPLAFYAETGYGLSYLNLGLNLRL